MKSNLKLVHSADAVQRSERLIVGEIHRASQHAIDRNKRFTRKYSSTDNAVIGMTRWMYQYGCVGDVCVIHHALRGLEIGTLKMTARGEIKTKFIYD